MDRTRRPRPRRTRAPALRECQLFTALAGLILAADGGTQWDAFYAQISGEATSALAICSEQLATAKKLETSDPARARKSADSAIEAGAPARDKLDAFFTISRAVIEQLGPERGSKLRALSGKLLDCVHGADLLIVHLQRAKQRAAPASVAERQLTLDAFEEFLARYPSDTEAGTIRTWRDALQPRDAGR